MPWFRIECPPLVALLVLTTLMGIASPMTAQADTSVSYAPKIGIRTTNGIHNNDGSSGGSSLSIAGLNLAFSYFLTSGLSIGAGYKIDFDYARSNVPLFGPDLTARWYPIGSGTRVTRVYPDGRSEHHDRYSIYVGPQFSHRSYFIGSNPTEAASETLNGSFMSVTAVAGAEFRMSRHFELVVEAEYGLLTFAGSDDRIRIRSILINAGITYVW